MFVHRFQKNDSFEDAINGLNNAKIIPKINDFFWNHKNWSNIML